MALDELIQHLPCTCRLNEERHCPVCRPRELERTIAQRNWSDQREVHERDIRTLLRKT